MKLRRKLLVLLAITTVLTPAMAKDHKELKEVVNRRSSLHTILIESDAFPRKETVLDAYNKAPFPVKYNNHCLVERSFNPKAYAITDEERAAIAAQLPEKTGAGKMLKGIGGGMKKQISDITGGLVDANAADMPLIIDKYFKANKIANKLVSKWYNRDADGCFNMQLIGDRGYYNASEMELNIAKGSATGNASVRDAGEELINKTFVVVNKLHFMSNEIVAKAIKDALVASASEMSGPAKMIALKGADKLYEKTKEGYSVWTTSYLYKLKWNDSIQNIFYDELWMDKESVDATKKLAFDNTDLFELEFVGKERAKSLVTFSLKETRTEEEVLALSTVRNIDRVYAKLQKKYDVFKTRTPLYSGSPISAKIGMKEGLEGGEKFEVFEQLLDPETGLTKYVSKGKITVDKKSVWDNRFVAGATPEEQESEASVTKFKGGKKFYSGMLIRQIK